MPSLIFQISHQTIITLNAKANNLWSGVMIKWATGGV